MKSHLLATIGKKVISGRSLPNSIPVSSKIYTCTWIPLANTLSLQISGKNNNPNTREIIFPLLIAHGVTGIRSMAADCFETGEPNCEEEGSSATLATIEDVRQYFEWAEETYARDLGDPAERAPHSRWVREFTGAMHQAGIRMLAGSDAGETGIFWGIVLHQELELLADAVMTEAEPLRAATLGPAQFLERTDSQGTVDEEKVTDLILLDANPLEDIRNTQKIRAVVANGRYFDRQSLGRLLSEAEKAANPQEGNNPKPKN